MRIICDDRDPPWINKDIKELIHEKNQAYKSYRQNKNNIFSVCSRHVTNVFQSVSTLYSCLNVKEFLAQSRRKIWRLSDCNWTRTQDHLVRKRTLNHLPQLTKWLSCVLSTYLYG